MPVLLSNVLRNDASPAVIFIFRLAEEIVHFLLIIHWRGMIETLCWIREVFEE